MKSDYYHYVAELRIEDQLNGDMALSTLQIQVFSFFMAPTIVKSLSVVLARSHRCLEVAAFTKNRWNQMKT